jgi:hypothetical protein
MNPELLALMIPIVAIVMGIGIGMLAVYLDFHRKSETFKLYHAERMAAIEKGIDLPALPPEFFGNVARESNPARTRRTGLVLLLLGLAVAGAMWGMDIRAFWWGFVPAAIGLAFLISSILEMRERKASAPG